MSAATAGDTLDPDGYTVTLDGGDARALPVAAGETLAVLFSVACEPALFDRIVFHSDRDGNSEIYVMAPDGSSRTRLTNHDAIDLQPRVSPDGTRIAFYSNRDGSLPDQFDVYVLDADGSDVARVAGDPEDDRFGTWSADGATILFSGDRDGDPEIYRVGLDGSGLEPLTDNAVPDVRSRELPDGTGIVFSRFTGTDYDVFSMNPDGTGVVPLTSEADARDTHPDGSPGDGRIVFQTDRDGNDEVYVMDADGGSLVSLTGDGVSDRAPTWTPPRQ